MQNSLLYDSFHSDLKSLGISVVTSFQENCKYKLNSITENMIEEHLVIISEFHKRIQQYDGVMKKKFPNKTGRMIEQYKILNKKLKKDLKNISERHPGNSFEELLLEAGGSCLARAEKCIEEAYNSGYIDLIARSMKKSEICLSDIGFTNLRRKDSIEVINLNDCCFNMCELDCVEFLSKLKRRNYNFNWQRLVNRYCEFEELDLNSTRFILSLLSYPYEFVKCCNRYRYKKKSWTIEEYAQKLIRAIEKDGEALIEY